MVGFTRTRAQLMFMGETGLLPANYLHVTTGLALRTLQRDALQANLANVLILFGLAFLALVPMLVKRVAKWYEQRHFESTTTVDVVERVESPREHGEGEFGIREEQ